jgi:hypothetical protein
VCRLFVAGKSFLFSVDCMLIAQFGLNSLLQITCSLVLEEDFDMVPWNSDDIKAAKKRLDNLDNYDNSMLRFTSYCLMFITELGSRLLV